MTPREHSQNLSTGVAGQWLDRKISSWYIQIQQTQRHVWLNAGQCLGQPTPSPASPRAHPWPSLFCSVPCPSSHSLLTTSCLTESPRLLACFAFLRPQLFLRRLLWQRPICRFAAGPAHLIVMLADTACACACAFYVSGNLLIAPTRSFRESA